MVNSLKQLYTHVLQCVRSASVRIQTQASCSSPYTHARLLEITRSRCKRYTVAMQTCYSIDANVQQPRRRRFKILGQLMGSHSATSSMEVDITKIFLPQPLHVSVGTCTILSLLHRYILCVSIKRVCIDTTANNR